MDREARVECLYSHSGTSLYFIDASVCEVVVMSLPVFGMFLLALFVVVGIRIALFKWLKPDVESFVFPVETTTSQTQDVAEASPTTYWPVVILLGVVVTAIVSMMMFGHVLAGG